MVVLSYLRATAIKEAYGQKSQNLSADIRYQSFAKLY